jgi:hypothetical protein
MKSDIEEEESIKPSDAKEAVQVESAAETKEPEPEEEMFDEEAVEELRTMKGRRIIRPECYMAVTKVGSNQKEEATDMAIMLELTMLLKD